jgi:hypothetical protein
MRILFLSVALLTACGDDQTSHPEEVIGKLPEFFANPEGCPDETKYNEKTDKCEEVK